MCNEMKANEQRKMQGTIALKTINRKRDASGRGLERDKKRRG
jgi:hypothetical protein